MIDFKSLRFDPAHHLGLGDIRLTIDQQQEVEQTIADLLAALEAFTEAMDMHLGHQHEVAICKADDQARAAIAKATK